MRIAFDSQIFSIQKYGGISRYFTDLAKGFTQSNELDIKIFAPYHINEYLTEIDPSLVIGRQIHCNEKLRRFLKYANQIASEKSVYQFDPDIIHETFYSAYNINPKHSQRVITIHDLIDIRYKELFPFYNLNAKWKKLAIKRADHIICVSQFTKNELQNYFDIDDKYISVIYHGIKPPEFNEEVNNVNQSEFCSKPYILYVGQRWGYKNFTNFIKAYALNEYLKNNFKVVCFGGGSFTKNELVFFDSLNLSNKNLLETHGNDKLLNQFYRNAVAFVYPSLSEGFGFPPLEALKNGCPVIASSAGSIPEILGPSGIYFDPLSIDSISNTMESFLSSTESIKNNLNLTSKRYELFTLEKCINNTLKCYNNLL